MLTCDHTFRTSKHIGVMRNDGKFAKQFENVFLGLNENGEGLNENGEVMTWRFTKSTAWTEILDLLVEIASRHGQAGVNIELVCVDDCCHLRH